MQFSSPLRRLPRVCRESPEIPVQSVRLAQWANSLCQSKPALSQVNRGTSSGIDMAKFFAISSEFSAEGSRRILVFCGRRNPPDSP